MGLGWGDFGRKRRETERKESGAGGGSCGGRVRRDGESYGFECGTSL